MENKNTSLQGFFIAIAIATPVYLFVATHYLPLALPSTTDSMPQLLYLMPVTLFIVAQQAVQSLARKQISASSLRYLALPLAYVCLSIASLLIQFNTCEANCLIGIKKASLHLLYFSCFTIAAFLACRNPYWLEKLSIIFIFFLASIFLLSATLTGSLSFSPSMISSNGKLGSQYVSLSILFATIVVATAPTNRINTFAILTAFVMTAALGQRTEFGFTAAVTIYYVLRNSKNGRQLAYTFGTLGVAIIFVFMYGDFASAKYARIFKLWEDPSLLERAAQINSALTTIFENPLLGKYGEYSRLLGEGAYAHNALSAWAEFGILSFAFYIWTLTSPLPELTKNVRRDKWPQRDRGDILLLINFCLIAAAALTVSIFSHIPALVFGLIAGRLAWKAD